MKTIFTAGLLVLFSLLSFSQSNQVYDNIVQKTPFIFEGKVLSFNAIQGDDNKYFVSYVLEIANILRGDDKLKTGTIEMVTELPQYWQVTEYNDELIIIVNYPDHPSPGDRSKLELKKGTRGIFFCKSLNDYPSSKGLTDNSLSTQPSCNTSQCYISMSSFKGIGMQFKSKL